MRVVQLLFAVVAYLFFFASFLYLIGFVHNFMVPRSIDVGVAVPTLAAFVVNAALILLFGLQHSIMARPGFKTVLTRYWPEPIERSLYVLMTALVLCIFFILWQPLPATVWSVEVTWLRGLLFAIAGLGWLIVLISTFLLNHFELFGLHQVWANFRDRAMPVMSFREPFFYRLVRHPIYTGFLLAFWSTPDMSQGHLFFSTGMTLYILIGVYYEERDLKKHLGEVYVAYTRRVGMLIPGVGRNRS